MRQDRSLKLIADFVDGYAQGWYFAVGEYFKDELDIKYTQRVENGKKSMHWTQGPYFAFKEGATLYDTPKAYLEWNKALQHFNLMCEVIRATSNQLQEENIFIKGWVTFKLSKPNKDKSDLEIIGQYSIMQDEFVEFLRTGQLKKSGSNSWNISEADF